MNSYIVKSKNLIVLFVVVSTLAACCTKTSIQIKNQSEEQIRVQSMQTMKNYEVAPNDEECIPHTSGDILVSNGGTEKSLKYYLDVTEYVMDEASFFVGLPCLNHYSVKARYSVDSGLVVLNERNRK